jgi:hypothetical protein
LHWSFWVQESPSLHDVPSAAAGFEQEPVFGSHVPAVWHASVAAHGVSGPGVQAPAVHTSPFVQRFWSSHAVPSASAGFVHTPVAALQDPAAWHSSDAVQITASPAHAPDRHTSEIEHGFASSHAVPSGLSPETQLPVAGSQVFPPLH